MTSASYLKHLIQLKSQSNALMITLGHENPLFSFFVFFTFNVSRTKKRNRHLENLNHTAPVLLGLFNFPCRYPKSQLEMAGSILLPHILTKLGRVI